MIVIIKTALLITLSLIFFQDYREREVWAFLLPVFAVLGSALFFYQTTSEVFLMTLFINLMVVGILLFSNYLFARFVLKKSLFKEALGLGDVLFFIAFALSFPTIAFINFFVFSLLFSLILQQLTSLILKKNTQKCSRVPLAGYMSIFLLGVYLSHWTGFFNTLYLM